jgi:hypothetical protein
VREGERGKKGVDVELEWRVFVRWYLVLVVKRA